MKRVKFSRVRGSMRTSTVHYKKSLLSERKNGRGGEGGGKRKRKQKPSISLPQPLSVPITQADYSRTPLYGHLLNTDPLFLRKVFFVPGERKPLLFL